MLTCRNERNKEVHHVISWATVLLNKKVITKNSTLFLYDFSFKYLKLNHSSAKRYMHTCIKVIEMGHDSLAQTLLFWFPALHFLAEHVLLFKLQVFVVSLLLSLDSPEEIKVSSFSKKCPFKAMFYFKSYITFDPNYTSPSLIAKFQEELGRLRSIWESEKVVDQRSPALPSQVHTWNGHC